MIISKQSRHWSAALGMIALIMSSCAERQPTTTEADRQAINTLREQWTAALNAGDVPSIMTCWPDDGVEMPPGRSRVGKEAIRSRLQSVFDEVTAEVTTSFDEIVVVGDWAFARGTFTSTWTPVAGGEPRQESAKNLWILQRQPDDSWKIARFMFNNAPPPGTQ